MEKNYKNYVKALNEENLLLEKKKIEKSLSFMPLYHINSLDKKELTTKNVLLDLELQKRLSYRNQFVNLAKRVSEISQHFRWNYAGVWSKLFYFFYKENGDCILDIKFNTLINQKGGFVNSLDATSLKYFNEYLKHYLQYIKENRQEFEEKNNNDIKAMKQLKIIDIAPSYTLAVKAIEYANQKNRENGFSEDNVVFDNYFDSKWKNYYISLKKLKTINNEQKQRLQNKKPKQLELEF